MTRKSSLVAERQAPLRREYVEDPERATTVKWAATETSAETDALHSVVHIGRGYGVSQLAIDRAVKVGFRSMTCRVHLRVPSDIDPHRIATLRKQAEHSCVNLDTLRSGVAADLVFTIESALLTP